MNSFECFIYGLLGKVLAIKMETYLIDI